MKKLLCLALVILMLVTAGCQKADQPGTTNTTGSTTADNTQKEDPFVPVMRFVVTSDVHIREEAVDLQSRERLSQLYDTAYSYADNHPDYKKLDAIFFVGDITNNGTVDELTYFFDYVKENTREGTLARAVMGNHEVYDAGGFKTTDGVTKAAARFLEISEYETTDVHLTLSGYHFIMVSPDLYKTDSSMFFSAEKLIWIRQELDKAKSDTPDKPIFLFQHEPPRGTMVGSTATSGDQLLHRLLKDYPHVIDFSGHTHVPMTNPNVIWQGEYTALNTASLAYLSIPIYDANGKMTRPKQLNETGAFTTEISQDGPRNAGMYYIVEIDAKGVIRILRYNIFTRSLWGEPFILDSINPADFKYTNARKEQAEKPVFDASAAITVESADAQKPMISFPQATCKDIVANYRIEIYQGETLVATQMRIAETFYGDATPNPLKTALNKLEPGTYTLKVFATSSYALHSEPITGTLTIQ